MRTTKTSPRSLWMAGQVQNPTGLDILVDDVQQYGTEEEIDDTSDDENEEGRPIFFSTNIRPYCRPC